jgi:hypothetical protein
MLVSIDIFQFWLLTHVHTIPLYAFPIFEKLNMTVIKNEICRAELERIPPSAMSFV